MYMCFADYSHELELVMSGEKLVPDFFSLEDLLFKEFRKSSNSHKQLNTETHQYLSDMAEYRHAGT